MATELGIAGPVVQATLMSTDLTTKKSEALDCTPLLTTSRANLCGSERKDAGMVAMISLSLTTCTFPDGMGVPSRRTCAPAMKPAPKICTPGRSLAEASAACGTEALGMPPMTPGPGLGLGTTISVISAGFKAPRLMTSIWPLLVLPAVGTAGFDYERLIRCRVDGDAAEETERAGCTVLNGKSGRARPVYRNDGVSLLRNRIGDGDLLLIRVIGNDGIRVRLPSDVGTVQELRGIGAANGKRGAVGKELMEETEESS